MAEIRRNACLAFIDVVLFGTEWLALCVVIHSFILAQHGEGRVCSALSHSYKCTYIQSKCRNIRANYIPDVDVRNELTNYGFYGHMSTKNTSGRRGTGWTCHEMINYWQWQQFNHILVRGRVLFCRNRSFRERS